MKKILTLICILCSISLLEAQTLTKHIVVDQFGYRPESDKVAVIRDPQTGFDAADSYNPGNTYALVDANSLNQVFTGNIAQVNDGVEDASSGDVTWWFDFSEFDTPGSYYVLDVTNNTKSFEFEIREDIYNEILKQAMRSYFYQRSGFEKALPYADADWTDAASHIGPLQDKECRSYDDANNPSTEKDVHGGWYDAGDLNKYTPWTASYVFNLLQAYRERPEAWADDYNIPESGNGIPDVIDEAKWGIEHLRRLQNADGSSFAVVDASHASPPSAATGASLYGDINTTSALSTSGALAISSMVYRDLGMVSYADSLLAEAELAWDWAVANPNVLWENNVRGTTSEGIGAGNQETDDYGRRKHKLRAAAYLYEATGDTEYSDFVDANYNQTRLYEWFNTIIPEERDVVDALLHYAHLNNATASVSQSIINSFNAAMNKGDFFPAVDDLRDPYRAYLRAHTWGSNSRKSSMGIMYASLNEYNTDPSKAAAAFEIAENYVHYIHGVNPMNIVYLTNMYDYGAENSANQIFHEWFGQDTQWDNALTGAGPAPGIVPGGPNPNYSWDACCPSGCGSANNNARCFAISLDSLLNQPDQKSYKDFNESWPLNSWSVTENSLAYQCNYIRLLSKFVDASSIVTSTREVEKVSEITVFPNPSEGVFKISQEVDSWTVLNDLGQDLVTGSGNEVNVSDLESGSYMIQLNKDGESVTKRIVIK